MNTESSGTGLELARLRRRSQKLEPRIIVVGAKGFEPSTPGPEPGNKST